MDADVWSFFLCIVTGLISLVKCELSAEECLQLGLRKSDLMCNWCDQLVKHDLEILVDNCHQCCGASGSKDPIKKYPRAQLEVCG